MAKNKNDGVIEAVRYQPDGQIAWVRAYLRRGATYTDRILVDRATLILMIKSGKNFQSGKRLPYLGGTFDLSSPVRVVQTNGKEVLTTSDTSTAQDNLAGVPLV